MTSGSLGKTLISLCPASFHVPRPNLPVTPGIIIIYKMCRQSRFDAPYWILWPGALG